MNLVYTCPLRKEEGGCDTFLWKDQAVLREPKELAAENENISTRIERQGMAAAALRRVPPTPTRVPPTPSRRDYQTLPTDPESDSDIEDNSTPPGDP
ncbi:Protein of unknown function [Pyronema omphalodes CBS 100304]|uniref:Uncharacterized protein n=1 Tax=Pyronema omphalodes (strain CBS 100304) TaxID=1076935 RepID=U4L7E8_PYROM|nr:Protein of unknown function [Pyronema omphalodes CBS 100304]